MENNHPQKPLAELVEDFAALSEYLEIKENDIASIKKAHNNMRAALQAMMSEADQLQVKTKAGHLLYLATSSSFRIVDGEAFYDFVDATPEGSQFLERRAAAAQCKQYVEQHKAPPPGLEMSSITSLRFMRKK